MNTKKEYPLATIVPYTVVMPLLDVSTMLFLLMIGNLAVLAVLSLYRGSLTQQRFYHEFMLAKAAQALAWSLLFLRGSIPDVLSVYLGNALNFFGFAAEAIAFVAYRKNAKGLRIVLPLVAVLGTFIFIASQGGSGLRVIISSICIVALYLPVFAVYVFSKPRSRLSLGLGLIMGSFCASLLVRALVCYASIQTYSIFTQDPVQLLTFIPLFLMLFAGGNAFVLLMKEQDDAKVENALKKYNVLFDLVPASILLSTLDEGRIIECNDGFLQMTGHTRDRALGTTTTELGFWSLDQDRGRFIKQYESFGGFKDVELEYWQADGTKKTALAASRVIPVDGHEYALSIMYDISSRKRMEHELEVLLEGKDLLLKEVHHRIKNNMSIIASLLSLQAEDSNGEETKTMLDDTINRIKSISLLYDKLYRSQDYTAFPSDEYIRDLVARLKSVFPGRDFVKVVLELDPIMFKPRLLSSLGLVINELYTNSMKHAFVGKKEGSISIRLLRKGEQALLTYHDDGLGQAALKPGTEGMGLLLLESLSQQLNVDFLTDYTDGFSCEMTFVIPVMETSQHE